MKKDTNNVFQTILVVYNIAIISMFIFFILKAKTGGSFIFIGIMLFFANLILPHIIFLRQQSWGGHARSYEKELVSPISKGLKDFKNSTTLERLFTCSYIFWLIFSLLIALYGWLIR